VPRSCGPREGLTVFSSLSVSTLLIFEVEWMNQFRPLDDLVVVNTDKVHPGELDDFLAVQRNCFPNVTNTNAIAWDVCTAIEWPNPGGMESCYSLSPLLCTPFGDRPATAQTLILLKCGAFCCRLLSMCKKLNVR